MIFFAMRIFIETIDSINMFIEKSTFEFIYDLKIHNTREWFNDNRTRYEAARDNFIAFTEELIKQLAQIDPEVAGVKGKEAVFRIFRDVRFSKNKDPYKPNFGCYIANGGRKSIFGGYYFHLEADGSFAGGGVYHPMPEQLKSIRNEIYYHYEEFDALLENEHVCRVYGSLADFDRLKRPPKGFDSAFKGIAILKNKSYTLMHPLPDELVVSNNLINRLIEDYKLLLPFNRFINKAIKMDLPE